MSRKKSIPSTPTDFTILSPALAEPEWVRQFCYRSTMAFDAVNDLHESPSFSAYLQEGQLTSMRHALKLLYEHIMEAWKRRDPTLFYRCQSPGPCPAGVIDSRVRDAYIEAHEMFRELERRWKANPTEAVRPVSPLKRIVGLLAGVQDDQSETNTRPGKPTRAPGRNHDRDEFIAVQCEANTDVKKIIKMVNANKNWYPIGDSSHLRHTYVRYCKKKGITAPSRKPSRI
jgi:hypothetical protein